MGIGQAVIHAPAWGSEATVTLATAAGSTVYAAFDITATFSQNVTGFTASDLTLVNCTATVAGSGKTYTITVTPSAVGAVSVRVPVNVVPDGNSPSNTIAATYEKVTATLATTAGSTVYAAFNFTITFNVSVTGLTFGDFMAVNGNVSNVAGSGTSWSATFTPAAAGACSVQLAQDTVTPANSASNTISTTASVPVNTVAPAISADSPILNVTTIAGDNGTWTGAVSYERKWQKQAPGGAWSDITGATGETFAPADADGVFGCYVREAVRATNTIGTSDWVYSNATGDVRELPTQSWGGELVTNGNMETGDPPTNWTPGGSVSLSAAADERTGGSGSKSIDVNNGASSPWLAYQDFATTAGSWLESSSWCRNVDAGTAVPALYAGSYIWTGAGTSGTTWIKNISLARTPLTTTRAYLLIYGTAGGGKSGRFDDYSVKAIALNAPLTAPSANMRVDQLYTLPGTPVAGTQVNLRTRVSDATLGNYWTTVLEYTGAQWNVTLYSVATFTRTSRIAATNVGATTGFRVNMNGDQISLYTTANGTDWTQRGTTITNSTYQTATGVNAMWTSDVTIGNLIYAAGA